MPSAWAFAAVGVGAALGGWLRWFLVGEFNAVLPQLPLGTLIANVAGGFMVGFAVAWFMTNQDLHPNLRLFVITGFLGGLTTFSSFSAESLQLLQAGRFGWAALHSLGHVFGSLAAAAAGFAAFKAIEAIA